MAGPASVAPWGMLGPAPAEDSAFFRLWRGFATARVAIAAVVLLQLGALFTLGPPVDTPRWVLGFCAAYLTLTLAVRLHLKPRPQGADFDPQWALTIGVDLAAIATLQYLQAGGMNFAPLFAVPVLMASVLGTALLAYGSAACVTLLLLTEAWLANLQGAEAAPRFLQAGLTGTGYFALAFLTNQLALRLAGEERAARRGQRQARVQAQVNQLVIETLNDGVLVIDAFGEVQAANPAARAMLGDLPTGRGPVESGLMLSERPAWRPLAELADQSFTRGTGQMAELAIAAPGGTPRRVFVRTRLAEPGESGADALCVIFIEDLREMEARLRTEKLAAMGRMSAAVAHEIRNPLAAITQANALLAEDLTEDGQRQLTTLVAQNAQRLARIVDDILNVSRARQHVPARSTPLVLDEELAVMCRDWAGQTGNHGRLGLQLRAAAARAPFEAEHLRRVLVNLLDNAARYAGVEPDSIQVASAAAGGQAGLLVWSDGATLEASVQLHLFEPFFSSESRSSGLGLFICRELCEQHGASIGYRRAMAPTGRQREGNEFFISFRPWNGGAPRSPAFATIEA